MVLSTIVLSIAFQVIYGTNPFVVEYPDTMLKGVLYRYLILFILSFILVIMSFLIHELGHKIIAQIYGFQSEYRMYPIGLGIMLITSFFGFLFAAPGAVHITKCIDNETRGKISLAGPSVNIFLAMLSIIFYIFFYRQMFLYFLSSLNAFLAMFNLIPIRPFDGYNVFKWSKFVWALAIFVSITEIVIFYYMPISSKYFGLY